MSFYSGLSEKKRAFLTGTLLLTAAGFLCRLLGFFYRIFLSRTIGAEGLGIYNMVHPVYGICFALCGGSIQTALSQYIAAHESQGRKVFRTGLTISMALSGILAFLICQYPAWIASYILIEPRCAPYLPIMGLSLPFASFHACANGYCYGAQRSRVPAFSQVAEQVVRMSLVFLIAGKWAAEGTEITVRLAVYGHLIGELGAASFNLLCLGLFPPQGRNMERAEESSCLMPLITLALPLMGNRLILNLLAGAEAVWIPNRLQMSGLSDAEAFSVYAGRFHVVDERKVIGSHGQLHPARIHIAAARTQRRVVALGQMDDAGLRLAAGDDLVRSAERSGTIRLLQRRRSGRTADDLAQQRATALTRSRPVVSGKTVSSDLLHAAAERNAPQIVTIGKGILSDGFRRIREDQRRQRRTPTERCGTDRFQFGAEGDLRQRLATVEGVRADRRDLGGH